MRKKTFVSLGPSLTKHLTRKEGGNFFFSHNFEIRNKKKLLSTDIRFVLWTTIAVLLDLTIITNIYINSNVARSCFIFPLPIKIYIRLAISQTHRTHRVITPSMNYEKKKWTLKIWTAIRIRYSREVRVASARARARRVGIPSNFEAWRGLLSIHGIIIPSSIIGYPLF